MTDPLESLYRPSSPATPRPEFVGQLRRQLEIELSHSRNDDEEHYRRQPMMTTTFHTTVIPSLAVSDAAGAIDFYGRAFGATEVARMTNPNGKVAYAEIAIGDARIALKDEEPAYGDVSPESLGGTTVRLLLQVADVDALASQAIAAGATVVIPIGDRDYGYRDGRLADPFGHLWIVQTARAAAK